ncbi:MAG: 3'-5' exonuclease [Saprospirales bacterium]|nr:MAG: 3'-5' exonuclease [Saprospirales bacterium]
MINNVRLEKVLFLDIETVAASKSYSNLDDDFKKFWDKKALRFQRNQLELSTADLYEQKAGIFSEFGKIVCVSVGYFSEWRVKQREFRVKSFYGDDEKILLEEFSELMQNYFCHPESDFICGHNVREFDIPYIGRRMMVNHVKIPPLINIPGKKPWEVKYLLDTMELWKFGDYKAYTSLALLAKLFGVPTPKDDIDGSMVNQTYWEGNQLERIVKYCEKDVVATASVFLAMRGEKILNENEILSA